MIYGTLTASLKYLRLGLVEIFLYEYVRFAEGLKLNLTKNISTKPNLTYFKHAVKISWIAYYTCTSVLR